MASRCEYIKSLSIDLTSGTIASKPRDLGNDRGYRVARSVHSERRQECLCHTIGCRGGFIPPPAAPLQSLVAYWVVSCGSTASTRRKALPRWLCWFFSSRVSSANDFFSSVK